ncbi:LacI family transcriptional regulator [Paracoccus aurantiacus]|uniref:LacI family transcriptional regulator n=1 Tax=Paracoccus aurantiacus TaxID=2599412 RepID=A0A5C6S9S2_9RHOB|nr:LacI family DNA-binding transcriptional regulator [Paracoccus aurantiacus]TXB71134.1 LacI family transcriptional regulator [Paracoccus aurantiacus]
MKHGRKARGVRLDQVAERCGVSISTVSRALSNSPGVRDDLRNHIIDTARAMNYPLLPSVVGRKVMLAASSVAMLDHARSQFTMYVLDGLAERARALGVELLTRPVACDADEVALLEEAAADEAITGCLFLTLDADEMLTRASGFAKPIVLVNGDDPAMRHSSVTPCNRSAAYLATSHLLSLGHRRILFLQRPGRRTIRRRLEGWQDAMRGADIDVDDLTVDVDDWLPELGEAAILSRIAAKADFTAVLAAGDSLAYGAMRALQQSGIDVPGQVSVMGIDDLPVSAFSSPPLTTIHVPMQEIGAAALGLLLDELDGADKPPRRIELACRLVLRESTGPVV